jgi:hypothetical protein
MLLFLYKAMAYIIPGKHAVGRVDTDKQIRVILKYIDQLSKSNE